MKFKQNRNADNYVLEGDGFFISYNSCPWAGVSIFESDTGGAETALVIENKYKILNGDFRKEYEKLAPKGLDACLKFYDEKKGEFGSSWSSPDV